MTKRHYRQSLQDILDSIRDIEEFTGDAGNERPGFDRKTLFAVAKALENIGEAVKKLPPAIRRKHPAVPWQDMAGMRDVLIHDYFGIDFDIVWKTVHEDIPKLKQSILEIASTLPDSDQPPVAREQPSASRRKAKGRKRG